MKVYKFQQLYTQDQKNMVKYILADRRENAMKKAILKFGQCFAALAFFFATLTANSTCMIIAYQPEEPDAVKKLRKF